MRIRDVLLEDVLLLGELPVYDKEPEAPAYIVNDEGTCVLAMVKPHRVIVPMVEGLDADAMTLLLIKTVAEQGGIGIEWDGSFAPVQTYFNHLSLPFDVVLKHPEGPSLVPPQGVRTIESTDVEADRFYCLTCRELLGRRPTQRGLTDAVGLLIFNPKGVLTVFFEPGQRKFAIPPQA